jgi:hypothetical protein
VAVGLTAPKVCEFAMVESHPETVRLIGVDTLETNDHRRSVERVGKEYRLGKLPTPRRGLRMSPSASSRGLKCHANAPLASVRSRALTTG